MYDIKLKNGTKCTKPALARPRPPIRNSVEHTNSNFSMNVNKLKVEMNFLESSNLNAMNTSSNSDSDDIEDLSSENYDDDKYLTPDIKKELVSNVSVQESMNSWCDTSSSSSIRNFQNTSDIHVKRYKRVQNINTESDNVFDSTYCKRILIVLSAVCVMLCGAYIQSSGYLKSKNNKLFKDNVLDVLRESVRQIQVQFPNQEDKTWKAFLSQVEEVINDSTNICTVILFGNETNTINCLAQLLGEVSSVALGSNQYLTLKAINTKSDHGHIVQWLKMEVQEKRVMVVEDLQGMSPAVVKAFHYLCDKENPLVVKAVYIITIIVSGHEGIQEDKFVENHLRKGLSSTIEEDILDPLIARIIDGPIMRIVPEVTIRRNLNSRTCSLDKNSFHTI